MSEIKYERDEEGFVLINKVRLRYICDCAIKSFNKKEYDTCIYYDNKICLHYNLIKRQKNRRDIKCIYENTSEENIKKTLTNVKSKRAGDYVFEVKSFPKL